MSEQVFALSPDEFVRSIRATRDTLEKPTMKLLGVVARVRELTGDAPYAVTGGLAQILWARKSHTDDLHVALAAGRLSAAYARVLEGNAGSDWSAPENAHEADDVFEVVNLQYAGSVVDLLSFRDAEFNSEILQTARPVVELGSIRFIVPELLLCTHLLRPGPNGALAAVELLIARRACDSFDLDEARKWASHVGRASRFERVVEQANAMSVL